MNDCIFCKIIAGEIPAKFVYQDDDVVAFHDLNPVAPVHVLIVPRHHSEDILDLAAHAKGRDVISAILKAVPAIASKTGVADGGFRLINNCGADGGQTIRHTHVHLIGGRAFGEKLL